LADASIPLEEIYTPPDDEELEAITRANPQKKRIVPSMTFQETILPHGIVPDYKVSRVNLGGSAKF